MADKRRYSGPPEITIPAGGDWDETFTIRSVVTGEDMIASQEFGTQDGKGGDAIRATLGVAARLLLRWSLLDEDGQPLPISVANVTSLPIDMTKPLFDHVNAAFLAIQTPPPSATTS